jgi:hypothetical protein
VKSHCHPEEHHEQADSYLGQSSKISLLLMGMHRVHIDAGEFLTAVVV